MKFFLGVLTVAAVLLLTMVPGGWGKRVEDALRLRAEANESPTIMPKDSLSKKSVLLKSMLQHKPKTTIRVAEEEQAEILSPTKLAKDTQFTAMTDKKEMQAAEVTEAALRAEAVAQKAEEEAKAAEKKSIM